MLMYPHTNPRPHPRRRLNVIDLGHRLVLSPFSSCSTPTPQPHSSRRFSQSLAKSGSTNTSGNVEVLLPKRVGTDSAGWMDSKSCVSASPLKASWRIFTLTCCCSVAHCHSRHLSTVSRTVAEGVVPITLFGVTTDCDHLLL